MARKKKSSIPTVSFPSKVVRLTIAISFFVIATIFTLSFFDNAGDLGGLIFKASNILLGKVVYILPFFFVLAGLVLIGQKKNSKKPVFLGLFLSIISAVGTFGVFVGDGGVESGGWVGFIVAWPLLKAFGIWVSGIVFASLGAVAAVIFWQVLDHERIQESAVGSITGEKIKKIFEPKFEVSEVEPDIEAQEPVIEKKDIKEKDVMPVHALKLTNYKLPSTDLLEAERGAPNAGDVKMYSSIIKKTLQDFDIPVEISEVNIGPTVTQYSFKPSEGIKLAKITALSSDLALALAAHPLRIEAPIPGRSLVGIEVPNKARSIVRLKNLIEKDAFKNSQLPLLLALGKDVGGVPYLSDLAKMPHLLVAGATGAGKTIFLNEVILSLLFRNSPETMRLILVDPKRVEFPVYNDLPHLLTPVIVDTQKAVNMLKWLVKEMERRFTVLSDVRKRDIISYHQLLAEKKVKNPNIDMESLPYIVVIIDELADLMASRGKEIEAMIVRLAQMARAVGIHLIVATQRPSVEVITGLIKANITSRVAFQVASQIDSRTILDSAGAEKLLGQGDMLFISSEFSKPKRLQGAFVSDKDIKSVVQWIIKETEDIERDYIQDDELSQSVEQSLDEIASGDDAMDDDDPLYQEAKRVIVEAKRASASLLQRRLKLGYARAARLLDMLEERGIVGPADGAKPREVFIKQAEEHVQREEPKESEDLELQQSDKEPEQGEESDKKSEWISP